MTNINPFKIIMKVRTAMWYLFFQAIGIWLLSSCEQKDLCYDHNHASNVKVTFDWEQYPNANPASMCFYLFPREEGERTLKREFIGKNGGIAQALVGVSYTALGFNSDARNTSFRYNISTNSIEASSKDAGTIDRIGISASLLPRAKGTEGERMSMEADSIYSSASEKDILISLEENDRGDTCKITLSPKRRFCTYRLKIMNIDNQQNLSSSIAGSTSDAAASWTLSSDVSDVTDYTTTWTTPVTLGSDVSTLDATNVPFMILPQQLSKAAKASDKAYIAVKVKITLQGGYIQKDDWVYVGIDTNWEMGKRYAYTLDFTSGAGQDEDGKPVISGTAINLNVDVTPWEEVAEDLDPSGVVPTRPSVANSLIIDPTSTKAYGINIADKINAFWSSAVGDQTTPIVAGTGWTAEVIWQDIPSRAINFCSKSGVVKSGDTFEGKGTTPLYVKAAANVKGNVVVGIKKKGESNYLWSWHLWLTDEPQLVAGFMDRNLGAESATATDGAKTRGLYYQFGRKDPFVGSTEIYDINGTSKSTGATIATGKVTFAKAVQTPATFYTYGSGNNDWASPNNYTSKNWNDISESDGKTFFDPCPEGWRLPTKAEYSNFSTTTFTWDATNSGCTYNGNWFPAAGCRNCDDGSVSRVGSYGYYWSASPLSESNGYHLHFGSGFVYPANNSFRANGFSVRCVQE